MLKVWFKREITIEDQVLEIQNGNEELRNELIRKYTPFIKKSIFKVVKRYITSSDEEFSVGLLAFNDAIDSYKTHHNKSFLAFSDLIIQRRTIDFIRKEKKFNQTISFEQSFNEEEEITENNIVNKTSVEAFNKKTVEEQRREEILLFQQRLLTFGISFNKLTEASPKHKDARQKAIEVARLVANTKEFKDYLYQHKRLPLAEIEKHVSVSRKTLERNRIYIIAMCIVLSENFVFLQEYLK